MEKQTKKNPFAVLEEEVLDFWQKNKIFEKSVKKEAPKGDYVFYDGPPFITGMPHYASLLPSIAKDVVPRFWTMKGYRVERVWGWDCHGLPAENKVEKELGLKNKKDIEDLGVDKFVAACRNYVKEGSEQWEWYINRIARWVDIKNAYRTMDLKFMESVIWAFQELHKKGLIYEGYRSSLHCPRCATPLSKFEITMDAGSYKDVSDESVAVKFEIKNKKFETEGKVYILAWTTTPWTLPGNLALAINRNIDYVLIKANDQNLKNEELYIVAKDRTEEVFKEQGFEIKEEFKGEDLIGLIYEPLFALNNEEINNSENTYKIYHGDFVSTEEGTGVVHIAPNFGEDDFNFGKLHGLPMVDLMDEMGHYCADAGEFAGLYFKKAGQAVMEKLGNKLFAKAMHAHSYPFCYRCDSRLIYKTQKAWYLKISAIREKMITENKKINWVPEFFKSGRFQYNLENAPDWCLSRSRYWGSPIPVWRCGTCDEIKVAGSLAEIEESSGVKVSDLHRPEIDEVKFKCDKCGGEMQRVKEVFDCWFESGAMPFAQFHYPFEREKEWKNIFPADFIIEYTGQLRGWFYYLHVLSNALFDSLSFKNVIVTGVLAGTDGRKMSKSFGNYPDPKEALDKYGGDALRLYFMQNSIMLGDDASLSEKDIQDALRKNIMILWNTVKFYDMFSEEKEALSGEPDSDNILDKWILARLKNLWREVTENMEKYNLPGASRPVTGFIDDLSTWYLRRSRDRFKGTDTADKAQALRTTKYVLEQLAKIIAPFTPFIAEQVWQKVSGFEFKNEDRSVHLEEWPVLEGGTSESDEILREMEMTRKIVELGLAERDIKGIKVRQPLSELRIKNYPPKADQPWAGELLELIKDELNVKNIVLEKGEGNITVELDAEITPELEFEGMKREFVRLINSMRKESGFTINDRINIFWQGRPMIGNMLEKFKDEVLKETLANEIIVGNEKELADGKEFNLNKEMIVIAIKGN